MFHVSFLKIIQAVRDKVLMHLLVDLLALLVSRAGTENGTATLNQLSHEGAVVQFQPCFDTSRRVCSIVAGVFFDSISTTGNF